MRDTMAHTQDVDSQENAGDVRNIPAGPSSQPDDEALPARFEPVPHGLDMFV